MRAPVLEQSGQSLSDNARLPDRETYRSEVFGATNAVELRENASPRAVASELAKPEINVVVLSGLVSPPDLSQLKSVIGQFPDSSEYGASGSLVEIAESLWRQAQENRYLTILPHSLRKEFYSYVLKLAKLYHHVTGHEELSVEVTFQTPPQTADLKKRPNLVTMALHVDYADEEPTGDPRKNTRLIVAPLGSGMEWAGRGNCIDEQQHMQHTIDLSAVSNARRTIVPKPTPTEMLNLEQKLEAMLREGPAKLLRDPNDIERLGTGVIGIFKRGNEGLLHRTPESGEPRILVVINRKRR